MKKTNVVTARNIINVEEIDAFCEELTQQHPALNTWITKVLRKWLVTKAPATKYENAGGATDNMPAWLQNAINSNAAESVTLDGDLLTKITPILDYLNDVVEAKPDQDQTRISFDQATQSAKKWHEAMARKAAKAATRAKPVEEDGTKVVRQYDNGYYWVQVYGKKSMKREGDIMGHCVGRFGYFTGNLAGKKEIFSLRDAENGPHVTIEINNEPGNRGIYQIKGKANLAVKEEYLPAVKDFLKFMHWDTVNFDQADGVRADILAHREQKDVWTGKHGLHVQRDITNYYSAAPAYILGGPALERPARLGAYQLVSLPDDYASDYVDYLLGQKVYFKVDSDMYKVGYGRTRFRIDSVGNLGTVQHPDNAFTKTVMRALSRGDDNASIMLADMGGREVYAGYVSGTTIHFTEDFSRMKMILDWIEHMPNVPNAEVFVEGTLNQKFTDLFRHRHAGQAVAEDGSPKDMLDTFLTALRIAPIEKIVAASKALKGKPLTDAALKAHGIPVGGNTTMAYSLVLVLSMYGNKKAALEYLCEKPHALRNWQEVMHEKMAPFLDRMKFSEDLKAKINALLLNEYVRLLPNPTELADLDIAEHDRAVIANVVKGVTKRNVPAQSKLLWN
jgi:hypothetical protein